MTAYQIILGSASPRRKAFLEAMGLNFRVDIKPVDETYPNHLTGKAITEHIACKKASVFEVLDTKTVVMTYDTLVSIDHQILGKPKDLSQAKDMLKSLSGKTHEVISSICLKTKDQIWVDSDVTLVTFDDLSEEMINYYVDTFKPLDKAGAYGIQEWIGLVGVSEIKGSYNTVVGLPTHLLFNMLKKLP